MKIAILAPIFERVPAKKYGGTERVVYALTEELVKMGHDVTLFASGDSITSAKLVSVQPKSLRESGMDVGNVYSPSGWLMLHVGLPYAMQDQFDIIHDNNNLISAPVANIAKTPVVMTIHGALNIDPSHVALYESMSNIGYISISKSQQRPAPHMNWLGTVYNGTLYGEYPFSQDNDGYLLFVGRISRQKGVHHAINVARKLNLPLIIAAKLEDAEGNMQYFHEFVEPYLNDKIRWIGEVDEVERNKLMSKALCFLHPVTWSEPFGLTLSESMACGCPVIAFGLGSIPEIIVDGKTGFVITPGDEDAMAEAVKRVGQLNRQDARAHAFANYSPRHMAQAYLQMYQKAISLKKPTSAAISSTPKPGSRFEDLFLPKFTNSIIDGKYGNVKSMDAKQKNLTNLRLNKKLHMDDE
jgi:glycosyltransferase involved in cell wall biosynthesis